MSVGFTPYVAPSRKAMQVRFFLSAKPEELQRDVNAWLAEHPNREIVDVRQSLGNFILISVWYIES